MAASDIFEFINRVMHYQLFQLNQTPVTPASLVMFTLVVLLFWFASRLVQKLLQHKILTRFQIEQGTQYTMARLTHYLIMIVGGLVSFQFVGIDLSGLAVIFGLLSVGIGFGLQNVTSNFVAGLILLFERPIRIGDRVSIGELRGDVLEINMRSTTIRSLDNISIIVPNNEFVSSQVINWSHGDLKVRLLVPVGVSYNSDLETVIRCLQEVAEESDKVMKSPKPEVIFWSFGDSSWNMELRVWLKDPTNYDRTRSEINCAIVYKFRENGVEIPFPQRDLHLRTPQPLPISKADEPGGGS